MTRNELLLTDCNPRELEERGIDTAILPIGATEYHGNHLPYGTDSIMAEGLSLRLAAEMGHTVVLPPLAYGMSLHLLAWPWSLSLRPDTLQTVIIDIAESLLAHGITRLLVVSTHDGNPAPIENAARELNDRHGMTVAMVRGWQETAARLLSSPWAIDEDHGGRSEMSVVLALRPELARQAEAIDVPNQRADEPLRVFGSFDRVVPHGYSGKPSEGSAAEGEAVLDALAAHWGPFLRQLNAEGWQNGSWMSGIIRDE
ncbi:MAG TPA: creatininase family protein [Thermomicrobiales bacterium]|nr:creatininase family protein [Thermomicrobiales bacterium]